MVNYILIPSFIRDTLVRRNFSVSAILDFNKIREVLSINDIAILLRLQKFNEAILPNSKDAFDFNLYNSWFNSSSKENNPYLDSALALSTQTQTDLAIKDRIFNPDQKDSSRMETYEINDLGSKYYGIVLFPGIFPNKELSSTLIKDIIRGMYVYCPHDEIAETTLFRYYVQTLQ